MSITLCSQQRRSAAACKALAGTHHHHPLLLTRCPRTMWLMVAIKWSISDRAVNEFGEDTDTSAFTLEKLSNIWRLSANLIIDGQRSIKLPVGTFNRGLLHSEHCKNSREILLTYISNVRGNKESRTWYNWVLGPEWLCLLRAVTLCLDSAAARVPVSPVLCVLSPLELSMGLREILQCPEKGTSQRF